MHFHSEQCGTQYYKWELNDPYRWLQALFSQDINNLWCSQIHVFNEFQVCRINFLIQFLISNWLWWETQLHGTLPTTRGSIPWKPQLASNIDVQNVSLITWRDIQVGILHTKVHIMTKCSFFQSYFIWSMNKDGAPFLISEVWTQRMEC